jgi:hypothetical protein
MPVQAGPWVHGVQTKCREIAGCQSHADMIDGYGQMGWATDEHVIIRNQNGFIIHSTDGSDRCSYIVCPVE